MIEKVTRALLPPTIVALSAMAVTPAQAANSDLDTQLQALKDLVARQQQAIDALQHELDTLRQKQEETKAAADAATSATTEMRQRAMEQPLVTSGHKNIKVAISGQVNRAVNVADDGHSTKAYFVDNDVSNSRFRIEGTGEVDDQLTVGTVLEFGVGPNNSYDVSQENESAGDFFDERKVEAYVDHKRLGRVWLGKGPAATDDTAEYDLSLVAGPIMYAGVADPVGGLRFRSGKTLSSTSVGDAFFDFDGERQNRIRYDTPVLGPGVQLSASAGENQRYDLALNWGGDFGNWTGVELGPFLTLGALGLSEPNQHGVDYRLDGSYSILHQPTGLSLTLSAGMDQAEDDNPFNLYGKLGWDTSLVSLGKTGFGIDIDRSKDVSSPGDEGYSVGLAAVQQIENYGTEFYTQLRWFTLDSHQGPHLDDLVVGTFGTRVKF